MHDFTMQSSFEIQLWPGMWAIEGSIAQNSIKQVVKQKCR